VRGDLITVDFIDEFVFEKESGVMTAEEIAAFERQSVEKDKSRDLDGIDDGGEANRIVEEVDDVLARGLTLSESNSLPGDL